MTGIVRDVTISSESPTEFLKDKHVAFLLKYAEKHEKQSTVGLVHSLDFLRLSGVYWCLNALHILGHPTPPNSALSQSIVDFVRSCWRPDQGGGYAPAPNHDAHLLSTLSAIQVLILVGRLHNGADTQTSDAKAAFNRESVAGYIQSRQLEDGSFTGDKWGEVDSRFSLCALAGLRLIDRLDRVDCDRAAHFLLRCWNGVDGGFGRLPGSESHAGQAYCCVAGLAVLGGLDGIPDVDLTGWWLAERQLPSGGLNGRPEKAPDVCYSWWAVSCLAILDRLHWIDARALKAFIFASQDIETGGIADRPGDLPDPFHTLFGVAGLSLVQTGDVESADWPELEAVSPVFCLPMSALRAMRLE